MQSRLLAATNRALCAVSSSFSAGWIRAASSTARTADPAIHAENPEGMDAKEAVKAGIVQDEQQEREKHEKGKEGSNPFSSATPPYASSTKLESRELNQSMDSSTQQKRRHCHKANGVAVATAIEVENISCAGLDGSPLPMTMDEVERRETQQDDKAYFKDRKPSPLSEVEYADTRKPITRATDSSVSAREYGGGGDVIGWKPEQLDTAEETLRRAAEIWRESAMRGDPDSPQSRVLRALRGELS
ncbi:PREDICTED: uncharacterized protein LOC104598854 [Nelumbo nucifera]|uniref:Uncharacterized protein n=2 Tax=Nelumbo nucifera TaxID=4432 RepID=A0A822Z3W6_NELNU|nr:PREDICTED: uncharacterized protein LOC104598854 [Nelumbo nucifera]DAD38185.1 TPA_asm: hypothetical protein HUJ06_008826 [Nelumbo nucifera]